MSGGQHEAVAVEPIGRSRIVVHYASPKDVCQRRERHGRSRVTTIGFLRCIERESADHIDRQLIEVVVGASRRWRVVHVSGGLSRHMSLLLDDWVSQPIIASFSFSFSCPANGSRQSLICRPVNVLRPHASALAKSGEDVWGRARRAYQTDRGRSGQRRSLDLDSGRTPAHLCLNAQGGRPR